MQYLELGGGSIMRPILSLFQFAFVALIRVLQSRQIRRPFLLEFVCRTGKEILAYKVKRKQA